MNLNNRLTSVGIVCFIVIAGFVGLVNFESKNAQGTPVSGSITTDTIWDLSSNPYIVIGDVWVEVGVTLTIDPGVQVRFDGYYSIYVNGTINAVGADTNRINITSNMATPLPSDWRNIQINPNGHADMEYNDISYGSSFYFRASSNNTIANSTISYNKYGLYFDWSSNNTIANTTFSSNEYGLYSNSSSSNKIVNNTISNSSYGLYFNWSSNNRLVYNSVSNSSYSLYFNSSSSNVIANNSIFSNNNSSIVWYGIGFINSSGSIIMNNSIFNKIRGISLYESSNNLIENNNILENENGIHFEGSSNNTIMKNNIASNGWGIYLGHSSNNTIMINCISNNGRGIIIPFSNSNNIITNNSILGNVIFGINSGENAIAQYNYWGTTDLTKIERMVHNINYSNPLSTDPTGMDLQFIGDAVWSGTIYINNGTIIYGKVIVNGATIVFNHSKGQNFIQVNGKMVIENSTLKSNYGLFTVLYTNNSIGYIKNSTIMEQRAISLEADGFTISGNKISHGWYGVFCGRGASKSYIANNEFLNNIFSIEFYLSSNNTATDNIITNGSVGVTGGFSSHNTITKNKIFSSGSGPSLGTGVHFYSSSFNKIMDNIIYSYEATGLSLSSSSNNTIDNNIIYSSNSNGIALYSSSNNRIINNYLSLINNNGIFLFNSDKNNIIHNNVSSNSMQGIYLVESDRNNINYNNVSSNNLYGLYLQNSDGNNFTHNVVSSTTWYGIFLIDSLSNSLYHNNIINNPFQAFDNTNNSNRWDNGYPTGGNYWSDYSGIDLNRTPSQDVPPPDGIGDTPYLITIKSQDNYPLINPADTSLPTISNLQPPDTSTTNDNTPIIGADYTDPSGINVSSVILKVDGINVTSLAVVTANDVTYNPMTALSDGIHTVYLEVKDNVDDHNLVYETWTFTVDTTPPTITNLQPPDASTTNDNTPTISADYADPSGINMGSVILEVDGVDVTPFAVVTASSVAYTPGTTISENTHMVYLSVRDNVGNLATITWTFTMNATPPTITNLQPPDTSTTNNNTPTISAEYSDASGIDVSSVLLEVDGVDVTLFATVTVSNVTYLPGTALSDDIHTIYLEVKDIYGNLATTTWNFTVDTLLPLITNLQPPDLSTTNDSTPTISAEYSDVSGINESSVVLKVDGVDVTLSAIVTASSITYTSTALTDNIHTVYLEAEDNVGNLATASWSFTVDTIPPLISNLRPSDASTTNDNTTTISADFSDPSGIKMSSVVLKVNGIDVTSFAVVTATDVNYTPGTALSDDIHTVYLEVRDIYGNLAIATWTFTVDATPPVTTISPDSHTVKLGTLFTLIANDGVTGSGVNYTQYKIDDGNWIEYLSPFSIDTYEYHNITYQSIDNLGNIENENTLSIYIPKVPLTTISIGTPQYGSTTRFVNFSTLFSFSVIDYSGLGYDTYYYIGSSSPISYIESFTVGTEGTHTIHYYSIDRLGNIEDTKSFDIIVDNTPPTTTMDIEDPYYVLGYNWVCSASEFSLETTDDGQVPVGVNHAKYRIWNGLWSDWIIYQDKFISEDIEGTIYIEFYSVDLLGNTEPINNRTFVVDNTPPSTTIIIEEPNYRGDPDDILNVSSETKFVFSVFDVGLLPVGFDITEYRIWNKGSWSEWYEYSGVFSLDSEEGSGYIEWYGVDKLGNKETTNNLTVFVDNSPPTTDYILQLEPDNSEARISLIPSDIGSQVAFTKYQIDSGIWITYSGTFLINEPGLHTISFFSEDNIGNAEGEKNFTVKVENTKPVTPPDEKEKEANYKPLIAFLFALILLIIGTYVSIKRPIKIVKENKSLTWLLVVPPFVIAEALTGVVSYFSGVLSVPPIFGPGIVADLAILISGLLVFIVVYRTQKESIDLKPNLYTSSLIP
jgi:parallel beta-helix repeat protein